MSGQTGEQTSVPTAERRITGRTKVFLLLADPVAHVVGTAVINGHFAGAGVDFSASPAHVPADDLPTMLAAARIMRNLVGLGITIPHKIAILPLLDAVTDRGRAVGAVNFVRREGDGRLVGDNIDGIGFVAGLKRRGIEVAGKRVLQAGAGGVGRAIAFALAEAGAAELVIINRDAAKGAALAAAVSAAFPTCRARAEAAGDASMADIVVNATALGMKAGDALPLDLSGIRAEAVVAEVVMTPVETPILAEAARHGCRTVPGRAMLDEQMVLLQAFLGL
ncbi:shikimate dehydrogenase [Pseudoxanthobacter sp. M-2]|uniref:shikimate dehydrogenase family protein n=1 Tax=Pseudoxanthobacter sp. M-2 TaxID=3078754 RepID=UPI0038FD2F5F